MLKEQGSSPAIRRIGPPALTVWLSTVFGKMPVIVDPCDVDLCEQRNLAAASFSAMRLALTFRDPVTGELARLQHWIARRHMPKRPTPEHNAIGFRNGWYCDFRSSNLYWATVRDLRAAGNVRRRQDRCEELRAIETQARADRKAAYAAAIAAMLDGDGKLRTQSK